jgi:hypothetical protein
MGSLLPRDYARLIEARRFLLRQRTRGFAVPKTPVFDEKSTEYFLDRIRSSKVYLEYGAGGSTLVSARYVQTLVSVDSDKFYLKSVEQQLEQTDERNIVLIHANVGPTGPWGVPIFQNPTTKRVRRWAHYSSVPWKTLRARGLQPDTILVDGRFRAACVLESARQIKQPEDCRILVDDYAERPCYHIVERYCDIVDMRGRMAILRPKAKLDHANLTNTLSRLKRDFR